MSSTENLRRGDVVVALKDLTAVPVTAGTLGVVFEEAGYHEPGTGPMVRWFTGHACNVYDGWVDKFDGTQDRVLDDMFERLTRRIWRSSKVQKALDQLAEADKNSQTE